MCRMPQYILLIIGDVLIRHTTLYSAVPVLDSRNWFWEAKTGLRAHIHTTRVKIR